MWQRYVQRILDALIPLSTDALTARSLTIDDLSRKVNPRALPHDSWITVLFSYADPHIRSLIRAIKYRGETVPLDALARIVADEMVLILEEKKLFAGWGSSIIIPVPSSKERVRKRGYNQAERIAKAISKQLPDMGYETNALKRHERASQVEVSREKRERNISGAFYVATPQTVHNTYIILIDDVVESGTTLKDARRALIEAGASDVIAIAIAH